MKQTFINKSLKNKSIAILLFLAITFFPFFQGFAYSCGESKEDACEVNGGDSFTLQAKNNTGEDATVIVAVPWFVVGSTGNISLGPKESTALNFTVAEQNQSAVGAVAITIKSDNCKETKFKWLKLTDSDTDNSDPTYIQLDRSTPYTGQTNIEYHFSPETSPGRGDNLEMRYTLESEAYVSIQIFDSAGNLVRNLIYNQYRDAGQIIDMWDGLNDNSELVEGGTYSFILEAVNTVDTGDVKTISGTIFLDNTPPLAKISLIKADTPSYGWYTVMGTATDEKFNYYNLNICEKNLDIVDFSSTPIENNTLGVFDASALEDGTYTLKVTAYDHGGNSAVSEVPLIINRNTNILKLHINSVTQKHNDGSEGYVPTSDDPDVWIDDNLPEGATSIDSWNWDTGITYSGNQSHTNTESFGVQGHYFIHANKALSLSADDSPLNPSENIIQYVFLDSLNPPNEILMQFYTDDGDGEHRVYWGSNNISTGGKSGTSSLYNMGSLPTTGKWIRLKIPSASAGLTGKSVKGVAFVTLEGKAWWDKTTKSSDYNENQKHSWLVASDTGNDNSSDVTISYFTSQGASLSMSIYDAKNKLVKTLINNEFKENGTHETTWNRQQDGKQRLWITVWELVF